MVDPVVAAADAAETTSEAAGAAAVAATAAVDAQNAIEAAETRTEAAEDAAEDLAAAVLQTELGRAITTLQERCETWQNEHAGRMSALTADLAQVRETTDRLSRELAETIAKLQTPALLLTPQPSPETAPIATEPAIAAEPPVIPAAVVAAPMLAASEAPAKRSRWI